MDTQRVIFTYVSIMGLVTTQLIFFAACDATGPHVGICYGTLGNNLPTPPDVVNLFKKNTITNVRIYDPNPDILNALRGSKEIFLLVGVRNEDIQSLATVLGAATTWVQTNIVPFKDSVNIAYVVVGNEVIPGPYAMYVAQAILNMKSALISVGLPNIRVSTTTTFNLKTSFPPSAGAFGADISPIMRDVANALRQIATPLLVSMYPYFSYAANTKDISFEYATFQAKTPVMDGQLQYFSLLDAMVDAYHAALAGINASDVNFFIAETGWPSAGNEPITTIANAHTYISNFYKRVMSGKGTPRLPNFALDGFMFAMFDENQKPAGVEQHWGFFYPDGKPKYSLTS